MEDSIRFGALTTVLAYAAGRASWVYSNKRECVVLRGRGARFETKIPPKLVEFPQRGIRNRILGDASWLWAKSRP
jgi:hypothetical protein